MVTICDECGGVPSPVCLSAESIEAIIQAIIDALAGIGGFPQLESLNWVPFCDETTGNVTGYVATVLDEVAGTETDHYRDASFTPTAIAPLGEPCDESESEIVIRCRKAIVDGIGYNAGDTLEEVTILDLTLPVTNPNVVLFTQWQNASQSSTAIYTAVLGEAPVGDIPDPSHLTTCNEVLHREIDCSCMVDQLPTTLELVPYVSAFLRTVDVVGNLTVTPIGDFTDSTLTTPYTVAGTPIPCHDLESRVVGVSGTAELVTDSDTWELTHLTTIRVSISALVVSNPATPPVISFDGGTTSSPLIQGEPPLEISGFGRVVRPPLQIVTNAGDVVRVVTTRLSTT